jgi:hypothetical protein
MSAKPLELYPLRAMWARGPAAARPGERELDLGRRA